MMIIHKEGSSPVIVFLEHKSAVGLHLKGAGQTYGQNPFRLII